MKYVEEINAGDTFVYNNQLFVLSSDFKSNGQRMAINFDNGFPTWLNSETMVETLPLFKLDKDSNIIPIKNVSAPSTNIS
ncbi:MAG: hypothetical protein ACKO7N_04560 [Candidatus Nitrosotenuis sp.]